MAKTKKNKTNEFFEGIRDGTLDVIESLQQGKLLTVKTVVIPDSPRAMNPKEIVSLRKKQLNVSQQVFADMLNVSIKTVRSWEQGYNQPTGATLRLLQLTREQPDILLRHISSAESRKSPTRNRTRPTNKPAKHKAEKISRRNRS